MPEMIALDKKSFKLPHVEKEIFILLLRLGLEYNRETGFYRVTNFNNAEKLTVEISKILGSPATFLQTCSMCGKDIRCIECKYYEHCPTRNLPFHCVCLKCLKEG
jgi:hypothetical protein